MIGSITSALDRRSQIQLHAASFGVDSVYISRLVDAFYLRIRAHQILGPIFDRAMGDNWDNHLPRMKRFWESVALNTGTYSGKPVPAHQRLTTVEPMHFGIWLALFRQTLEDTAASQEAVAYFMERAERIAESLQLAMFGFPGLPVKRA